MLDKLAIVDVETTGLSPQFHRVIEVGVVQVDKGRMAKRWSCLVNPGTWMSPMISEITGISYDDLVNAPSFEEISGELNTLLKSRLFVAHNSRFDYGFISSEFERLGTAVDWPQLCTVRLSRHMFPEMRSHGLDAIVSEFGIRVRRRHRALDDAVATWKFLKKVRSKVSEEVLEKFTQ